MTFARYPYIWLPLVIAFGVLPTILVPFAGLFFAFVWAVVLLVAAMAAIVAAGWGLVAALRAVGLPLWWRRLGFVRASRTARAEASGVDGSPSLIRHGSASVSRSARSRRTAKPETRR
jgi:hypothetical protein